MSNLKTSTSAGLLNSPVTLLSSASAVARDRSLLFPVRSIGSTGVGELVRVGIGVAAGGRGLVAAPPTVRVGIAPGGTRVAVGGMSTVGSGVIVGATVRVGRSSGVGERRIPITVSVGVPASGVRTELKPGSKVGVGGTRVVAPDGVD